MQQKTRRKNRGRDVHGILLLDKPLGLSSNSALQTVKGLFNAKKAGHTGALDPLASGLLPICLGEATKYSQYSLDADKGYQVVAKLGWVSSTGDGEGELSAVKPVPKDLAERLPEVLEAFHGKITQLPPIHSAIKVDGKPLYQYARRGDEVERKVREVVIHRLSCTAIEPQSLSLTVECSKGTYIRTLVEDMGEALGCGAYVARLHRHQVHPYSSASYSLEQLTQMSESERDSCLLPADAALGWMPIVDANDKDWLSLRYGQAIGGQRRCDTPLAVGDKVRLYGPTNAFIGLAELNDAGAYQPKRLVAFE